MLSSGDQWALPLTDSRDAADPAVAELTAQI